MKDTKIEWCDHTMNYWYGCSKVAGAGACEHCYAEAWAKRSGAVEWGADRVRSTPGNWRKVYKWDEVAREAGRTDTVFSLSLGDFWDNHESIGRTWRLEALDSMASTPNLFYLILSKRIGNAVKMVERERLLLPPNVALGATVVTQEEWDRDVPKLKAAARVLEPRYTFVSVEPMLGPIKMTGELPGWVICGGESGSLARTMDPAWARSLRDQCRDAGVPFFFKQMTRKGPIPDDLLIREFPENQERPREARSHER